MGPLLGRVNLYAVLCFTLIGWCGVSEVAGSYLRDVELIGPTPRVNYNTVYYYPSYVKGEDPVEEFNRRRLHVDTAKYMDGDEFPRHAKNHNQQQQLELAERAEKIVPVEKRSPGRRNPKAMRTQGDAPAKWSSEHESNYLKIRQSAGPLPRYIRDDVEIFDIERVKQGSKRPPNGRRTSRTVKQDGQRRYEESDPQIFAYERADTPEGIGRANAQRPEGAQDSQYFQDTFQFQKTPLELEFGHVFESNDGWEERYEKQDHRNHRHQGKVKWADKQGGFGEHYWDLNHIQPAVAHGASGQA